MAVGGSLGFIIALGSSGIEWGYAVALLAGGVVAAPIAAWLVRILPARVLGVAAGGLIVVTNARTILESVGIASGAVWLIVAGLAVLWISGITWAVKQERASRALAADEADAPAHEDSPVPA